MAFCATKLAVVGFLLCFISTLVKAEGFTLEGYVVIPDSVVLRDSYVTLRRENGTQQTSFISQSGRFSFHNVPSGTYFIDVDAFNFIYPMIKVRRDKDSLKISAPEISSTTEIQGPIKIFPLGKLSYFEQRQAFNILAWLKTPYGIMIGFVILAMVIMPFLKIDQQEYQQIMNERRQASQQQQ